MKLAKKGKTKTLSLFTRILKWLNRQKLLSITSWTYGLRKKNYKTTEKTQIPIGARVRVYIHLFVGFFWQESAKAIRVSRCQ